MGNSTISIVTFNGYFDITRGYKPWLYTNLFNVLGNLQYFTHLAEKGDDSPNPNHIICGFRSRREVVVRFTQIDLPYSIERIYREYGSPNALFIAPS